MKEPKKYKEQIADIERRYKAMDNIDSEEFKAILEEDAKRRANEAQELLDNPSSNQLGWHSDLDKEIGLFLFHNRDLSHSERLAKVYDVLLKGDLDMHTLYHYAAMSFIERDVMFQQMDIDRHLHSLIMKTTATIAKSIEKQHKSKAGKHAVETRHNQPGGYRDKEKEIKDIFASGKYGNNRDLCAEKECANLRISHSTARKHLRGTPNPNTKPEQDTA